MTWRGRRSTSAPCPGIRSRTGPCQPASVQPCGGPRGLRLADDPFRAVRRLVWRHDFPAPCPAGTACPARPCRLCRRFLPCPCAASPSASASKIAVDGISLDVPAGSFFGMVGPNGAGKTTTLSMATGLLRPDFGTALVHGVDVWAAAAGGQEADGHPARRRPAVRPAQRRAAGHLRRPAARAWTGTWWRRGWRNCSLPWT